MPRKNKSSAPAAPRPLTGPQRLNKILAAAGLGSRREVEQYIVDGRIEVDGNPVTDLATKVDPETAKITFDGSIVRVFRPVYFALNKPVGVLSTNRDPSGRMRAIDLINVKERIFSAGRLDRSSDGLMLLTNDGELAQRLSHPRYGIQKLYLATVQGEVTRVDLEKLVRGVHLAEGFAKVDAVKLRKQRSGAAELEIALSEGKNREIRRILARLGHKVVGLRRLAIGPLRLGQLPPGGWRPLSRDEIQALYAAATTGRRKKRGGAATKKPRIGSKRAESDAASQPPVDDEEMIIGEFDNPMDDAYDDDDDFVTPSAKPVSRSSKSSFHAKDDGDDDSESDLGSQELGEDEWIVLDSKSVAGTVISYEDEDEESEADAGGDQSNAGQRRRKPPRSTERSERSPRGPRRSSSGSSSGSSTGARSGPRTGKGAGASRTGARSGPRSSAMRSGSRPAGTRSSDSRSTGTRSSGAAGAKSSGTRSANDLRNRPRSSETGEGRAPGKRTPYGSRAGSGSSKRPAPKSGTKSGPRSEGRARTGKPAFGKRGPAKPASGKRSPARGSSRPAGRPSRKPGGGGNQRGKR